MLIIFEKILNIVFPEECIRCKSPVGYICKDCLKRIPTLSKQPYENKEIFALYSFEDGLIQKILKLFKYKRAHSVAKSLSYKLYDFIQERGLAKETTHIALIPIPTTKKSLRRRGFDQTYLLAQEIVKKNPELFSLYPILKKKGHSRQQTTLPSKEARLKNSLDMFEITGVLPKNVTPVLIDDVVTTGATMESAQKILQKIHTGKIYGVTVAYQPLKMI